MCVCRMNTNVPLYQSLRDVVERGDSLSTQPYDDVDRWVARLFLNDFEQCGIHLDDAKVGLSCHYYDVYCYIQSKGYFFLKVNVDCCPPCNLSQFSLPICKIRTFGCICVAYSCAVKSEILLSNPSLLQSKSLSRTS